MDALWPWLMLAGLGAFHGLNPAMGWLFAVALGLQARDGRAVAGALLPIALGHAASIALIVAIVSVIRVMIEPLPLRLAAGLCLVAFGLYRLAAGYRHKFRVGMVAGFGDLTLWSFLMATAHGAGLMMAPVVLSMPLMCQAGTLNAAGGPGDLADSAWTGLLAVFVHTAAMLAVTGLVAWVVYARVGLAILRRGWINLELLWSGGLIGIGALFVAAATFLA